MRTKKYGEGEAVSDDIVTRLRQEWEYGNNAKGCDYEMFAQAADEIERLQKLISELASMIMPFALLMTSEEQEKVMKAVRGNRV